MTYHYCKSHPAKDETPRNANTCLKKNIKKISMRYYKVNSSVVDFNSAILLNIKISQFNHIAFV